MPVNSDGVSDLDGGGQEQGGRKWFPEVAPTWPGSVRELGAGTRELGAGSWELGPGNWELGAVHQRARWHKVSQDLTQQRLSLTGLEGRAAASWSVTRSISR